MPEGAAAPVAVAVARMEEEADVMAELTAAVVALALAESVAEAIAVELGKRLREVKESVALGAAPKKVLPSDMIAVDWDCWVLDVVCSRLGRRGGRRRDLVKCSEKDEDTRALRCVSCYRCNSL